MSQPLAGHLGRRIGMDRDTDTTEDRRPYAFDPKTSEPEPGPSVLRAVLAVILMVAGIACAVAGVGLTVGWPTALIVLGACLGALGVALSMG